MLDIPVLDNYETYEEKKDEVLKFCKQYAYAMNLMAIHNNESMDSILPVLIITQQFITCVECKDIIQKYKSLDNTGIIITMLRDMNKEMERIKPNTEETREVLKLYSILKFIGEYIIDNI